MIRSTHVYNAIKSQLNGKETYRFMLKIILLRSSTPSRANGVCVFLEVISQLIYAWSRSIFFILNLFLYLHFHSHSHTMFSRYDSMVFFFFFSSVFLFGDLFFFAFRPLFSHLFWIMCAFIFPCILLRDWIQGPSDSTTW